MTMIPLALAISSRGTTMGKITSFLGILFWSAFPGYAQEQVNIIDIVQAERFLQTGEVFIDNRPEHKFSLGHIPGAVNLPFFVADDPTNYMTRENLLEAIGDKQVAVFYCSGMMRAYHALKQAEQWGVSAEMYWYQNGFAEWTKLRKPVAR